MVLYQGAFLGNTKHSHLLHPVGMALWVAANTVSHSHLEVLTASQRKRHKATSGGRRAALHRETFSFAISELTEFTRNAVEVTAAMAALSTATAADIP